MTQLYGKFCFQTAEYSDYPSCVETALVEYEVLWLPSLCEGFQAALHIKCELYDSANLALKAAL